MYDEILEKIGKGDSAAMLTYLPAGSGPLYKMALSSDSGFESIPAEIRNAVNSGVPSLIEEEGRSVFVETFHPKERLVVLGGGHIALPLVKFASEVGFSVTVADDRPSFANPCRFPWAERVICETFSDSFDILKLSEYDYVVIITRSM
jgi:xanthine dehydrogenase accessory factor